MSPAIAAIAFTAGILGLFMLDRDPKVRSSFALAIPMVWLSIGGSRVVSEWLNPTTTMAGEAYIEGNPLDRNIQTMLMVAGMAVLFRRRRKAGRLLRANAPILIFFGYCALSILWSDYPATSFRRWVKAVGDVVMVMVVLTDPDPSAAVKMPARVGFILMPASILLMRYFPEMARGFDSITGQPAYTGVTTSKNSLGMICLIFGLGAVWRFLGAYWSRERAGRAGRLLAHGAVVVLVFWLLTIAHSMTSVSCLVLAVGLILIMGMPMAARTPSMVHILVAAILAVSASVLFMDLGGGVLETMGRDPSLTGRTAIWNVVLGMSDSPLFGTGYESFWLGDRLRRMWSIYRGINQAHNGYIEIFLNLGWTGVCLLIFAIVAGYRRIIVGLRQDPDTGRFGLAYFIVGVIYNFTEGAFKMMSPVWITFLLALMAVPKASVAKVSAPLHTHHTPAFADPDAGVDQALSREHV